MAKTARMIFRVTAEEKKRIKAAAANAGMTVSAYVRHRGLNTQIGLWPPDEFSRLLDLNAELREACTGLNDIMKMVHQHSATLPDEDTVVEVSASMKAVKAAVDELREMTKRV